MKTGEKTVDQNLDTNIHRVKNIKNYNSFHRYCFTLYSTGHRCTIPIGRYLIFSFFFRIGFTFVFIFNRSVALLLWSVKREKPSFRLFRVNKQARHNPIYFSFGPCDYILLLGAKSPAFRLNNNTVALSYFPHAYYDRTTYYDACV